MLSAATQGVFCSNSLFLTDVAHSWALADSSCISEVMLITYFFAMTVILSLCEGISFTLGQDQETNAD